MIRILLSFFIAALLASTAGAAAKPVPKRSDSQIDSILKTKLAKSKIGADHFTFRVQGGVVYWDGKTNVIQHKGAATRMAKAAGARAVVNKIQISDAAKARARANLESGRRRVQVKRGEPRSEARNEASRSR